MTLKKEKIKTILKKIFEMRNVLFMTYAMNLYDLFLSVRLFNDFGKEIELNPIGIWLYEKEMIYPAKMIGIGGALTVLGFMIWKKPKLEWTKWIVFGVYLALTIYHIFGSKALYGVMNAV